MKVVFQIVHQPASHASARHAGIHKHDHGTESGLKKVSLDRWQFVHRRLAPTSHSQPLGIPAMGRRVGPASFTVGSSLSFALSGLFANAFGWRLGLALLAL
jgi:hypothetical protein